MPYVPTNSIIDSLITCVDDIRTSIHAVAGDRPYRVYQVRTRWSGGVRGEGVESLISETEMIPTPRVEGISNLEEMLQPVGSDEEGGVTLSEISLTMTESEVSPLAGTSQIRQNEQFYYEIRYSTGRRRRFIPSGAPERVSGQVGWRLSLTAQDSDRNPSGTVFR